MKEAAALILSVIFAGAVWLFLLIYKSGTTLQPIAYNHKKHLDLGLECAHCHTGIAGQKAYAGLPSIDVCLSCHTAEDSNPKTQMIQKYASEGQEIPWNKVYRLPEHVYFSHRRHVDMGKLDCAVCHGDMTKMETPVMRQAVPIKMNRCIACHEKSSVTNDCLACHR